MRVLIVEDEKKIARFIQKGLGALGFAAEMCHHGDEAFLKLQHEEYDVVVLDIMLPGRDGLSILKRLREMKSELPVLLLSARGEVGERIEGLNLGADDYLPKPFSIDELVARLRALLRRSSGSTLTFYRVGDLHIHLLTREVHRGARKVELTAREFSLLEYLMRSPGQVFTRSQISEHVWGYHFDTGTNLVDVYIQRLRRKVDDGEPSKLLQTLRGVGYKIAPGE